MKPLLLIHVFSRPVRGTGMKDGIGHCALGMVGRNPLWGWGRGAGACPRALFLVEFKGDAKKSHVGPSKANMAKVRKIR